jgi:myosin heavy chain 9/10/11/14
MNRYASLFTIAESETMPPHIYGVTASAFRDLFESEKNQSLVISGESGSGKTECTKHALAMITSLSNGYLAKHRAEVPK